MNLGNTITFLRKQRKINQSDLAKKCKITQAYLSLIENDKKEPNLATLKKIAKGLDVPLPVIFFFSLEEGDVPKSKKEIFDAITPSLQGLVKNVFSLE